MRNLKKKEKATKTVGHVKMKHVQENYPIVAPSVAKGPLFYFFQYLLSFSNKLPKKITAIKPSAFSKYLRKRARVSKHLDYKEEYKDE